MTHIVVKALPIVERDTLSEKNQKVPETNIIAVDDSVPTDYLGNAALDAFHTPIPVAEQEAFEFEVWNYDCQIFEAEDAQNRQYESKGNVVG